MINNDNNDNNKPQTTAYPEMEQGETVSDKT